jgi:multiple sugar transport system permease protein
MTVPVFHLQRTGLRAQIRRNSIAYWFILPTLAAMLLVHIIPTLQAIYMSFLDLRQVNLLQYLGAPFVGLAHYGNILGGIFFGSDDAQVTNLSQAFVNTVWYTAWVNIATLGVGMVLALLLNRRFPGRGVARTLVLLPWVVPTFMVGVVWNLIWLQQAGLANRILVDWVGVLDSRPQWLIGPLSFWAIVVPTVWRNIPFTTVMLLSGLQIIPPEQYEAADIDGANAWQKFRFITIPHLRPMLSVLTMFGIVFTLIGGSGYNISTSLFSGASYAGRWADLLVPAIVRQSFERQLFGFGAAASVLIMLTMVAFAALWYRVFRGTLVREGE